MYTRIFSNGCIVLDLAGVQQGRRLLEKPNRSPFLSPPSDGIRTIDTSRPDKHKRRRKESHEAKDKEDNNIYSLYNDLRLRSARSPV
jgi:hypothetical protein